MIAEKHGLVLIQNLRLQIILQAYSGNYTLSGQVFGFFGKQLEAHGH